MSVDLQNFHIEPEFINQTEEYLSQFESYQGLSPEGFVTDFLGVKTNSHFFRKLNPERIEVAGRARSIATKLPVISAGEQYFELGSLLAAIHDCHGRFVMSELGGGWGARAVAANAIVRKINPVKEFYVIVEAMQAHCKWIRDHMICNGLKPDEHSIIQAAVWVDNTPILFPICEGLLGQSVSTGVPDSVAKLAPEDAKNVLLNLVQTGKLGIEEEFQARFGKSIRSWAFVSSVTLRDIFLPFDVVDYVDMDIQGAEEQVVFNGIDVLNQKVKRLHIGTHALQIHQNLVDLFTTQGWDVVVQIPPAGEFSSSWGSFKTGDGVLSVVNQDLKRSID